MEFIATNTRLIENVSSTDGNRSIQLTFLYILSFIGVILFAITLCMECAHRFRRRNDQIGRRDSEERDNENVNNPFHEYRPESFSPDGRETMMPSSYEYRAALIASRYETQEISELERTYEEHENRDEISRSPSSRKRTLPIPIANRNRATESRSNEFSYPSAPAYFPENYLPYSSDGLRTGSSLGNSSSEGLADGSDYKDVPQHRYGYSSASTVCADDYLLTYPTSDKDGSIKSTDTDQTRSLRTEVFRMDEYSKSN